MSCFFRHKWGKWQESEFRTVHITTPLDPRGFKRKALIQKRTCKGCGKIKYKDVGIVQ